MADEDLPISLLPSTTSTNDADYFVIVQDGVTKKIAYSDLFSSTGGISSINTLTSANQLLSIGTSGTSPNWASAGAIHTLNIPYAGGTGVTLGGISKSDYDSFANKQSALGYTPVNVAGDTMLGNLTLYADPTNAYHAATKNYVDGLITGIKWKESVKASTTASITLSGTQTIDGVSCGVGDRVLVKNQSTATENGIYIVASSSWSRATDNDTGVEILASAVYVQAGGTVNGSTQWANSNTSAITVGSTSITYSQIAGVGVYTAGSGLSLSAGVFSISAGGVTNTMLAGSIATSKLSSVNLNSLDALTYNSASFVKMTASGTFSLDTSTYLSASGLTSTYIPYYNGSALADSSIRKITGDPQIRIDDRVTIYGQNAINPALYISPYATGKGVIVESSNTNVAYEYTGSSTSDTTVYKSVKNSAGGYHMWLQDSTQSGQSPNKQIYDRTILMYTSNSSATTPSSNYGNGLYNLVYSTAGGLNRGGVFRFQYYDIANNKAGYLFGFDASNYSSATSTNITPDGVVIGSSGSISSSAFFQVDSTTKGVLFTRGTTSQKTSISSPVNALGFYDTDLGCMSYYSTINSINAWIDTKVKYSELFDSFVIDQQASPAGTAYVARFKPKADMIVTGIEFICTSFSSTETYYVGIYNSALTTKLTDGSLSVSSSGEKTVTVTKIKLTGGTTYYLVLKDNAVGSNSVGFTTSYSNALICSSKYIGSGALPSDLTSGGSPTSASIAPYMAVLSL